jgi:multiple sugar transport system permease protein
MAVRFSSPARAVAVWCVALVWLVPYLWLVASAFKSRLDITASPPRIWFQPTLANIAWVYNGQSLATLLVNSTVVSLAATLLTVAFAIPAAHLFARVKTGHTRNLFVLVLATRIAPPVALSLPLFILFSASGLRGSLFGLVLAHVTFNLPVAVWLLEGFFSDVPEELEMAARIDGQTDFGVLWNVTLPIAKNGIAVAALFVFVFSWNEYMMSSLLSSSTTRPLTPALPSFIAQATTQWGQFAFVALVATLPALLLVLFGRRFLAGAFSMGAVREDAPQ